MTMKKTELEKRAGLQIAHRMKHADALGQRLDNSSARRRARRDADRAAGLVPFAVKLPQALVTRLHSAARERGVPLDALAAALLDEALPRAIPR